MIRLDDDRYLDESLITHAEYQLFLDEQRTKGKYFQPDHWRTYRFPAGQAHTPVVGVRPADAEAFCEWLSQREAGDWFYRLPQPDDLNDDSDEILTKSVGYWIKSNSNPTGYALRGGPDAASLRSQIERILARAHDYARDLARARALDRDLDRALARTLDRDLALALDLTVILVRARDSARVHAVVSAFGLDRVLEIVLDRGLARDRAHALARALDVALVLATSTSSLDRNRAHGFDGVKEHDLWIGYYLETYLVLAIFTARIEGEFPAYEGIRIVKERRKGD